MKKLMIAAAVAALTAGAFADSCSISGDVDCEVVFEVKFSGKTGSQVYDKKGNDKGYAAVQKISGKGTLTFGAEYVEEFEQVKVGKLVFEGDDEIVLEDGEVLQWTYFGKDLENVDGNGPKSKAGKSFSLESDLGVAFEDQTDYMISVDQVAFGKVKAKLSKDGETRNGCEVTPVDGCVPSITLKKYSGWFTGSFEPTCADVEANPYEDCIPFVDNGIALIGGTWSAKAK